MSDNQHSDEIKYDPVPGFRPVFFAFMIGASLYLAIIFAVAGFGGGH